MRSTIRFGLVATCSFVAWAAVACGSSASPDVGESGDGDASVSDANASTNADGAATAGDSSSNLGANGDGSSNPTTAPSDGGTLADAGPGGDTSSMTCGATTCSIPGQTCCVSRNANQSTFDFACVAGTTCPVVDAGAGQTSPRSVALQCTTSANCANGEVCCISLTQNGSEASCKTADACANAPGDTAVLCDPAAPTAGCPAAEPCSAKNIKDWRLPSGFGTCGGQGN